MFDPILQAISEFQTIIIHRHSRPDGDALGSQIGLKHLILENFPGKTVYCVGDEAGFYSFMADTIMDEIPDGAWEGALALVLDCGGEHLVSDDRWKLAAKTARMDHHLYTGCFTDVEAIDSSYESCCGLICRMAKEAGWKKNSLAAQSLYTGMVTDSGRFRYDSTSAQTFALASWLMEEKIDTEKLYKDLYADDFENKKRKAQFLLKVQFTPNRVAWIYTTAQELAEMEMSTFSVSRGMVNTMADIRGTDIWVNFTEADGGVLCELRSSGPNINPIAVKYGGGGHAKASGAKVPDRETAMAMLRDLDQLTGEK